MNAAHGKIVQDNPMFGNSFWSTNLDKVAIEFPGQAWKSSFPKRKRI